MLRVPPLGDYQTLPNLDIKDLRNAPPKFGVYDEMIEV